MALSVPHRPTPRVLEAAGGDPTRWHRAVPPPRPSPRTTAFLHALQSAAPQLGRARRGRHCSTIPPQYECECRVSIMQGRCHVAHYSLSSWWVESQQAVRTMRKAKRVPRPISCHATKPGILMSGPSLVDITPHSPPLPSVATSSAGVKSRNTTCGA